MPKPTHFAGTGVELWFGGSDTPVPPDPPETTSSPAFTVAVAGYGASDRVLVRYTVDGRNGQTVLGLPRKGTLADGGAAVTFLYGEITGLRPGADVTYTITLERRAPGQLITLPAAGDPAAQSYRFIFAGKTAAVRSTALAASASSGMAVASSSSTATPAATPQAPAPPAAQAPSPPKATPIPGLSDRAVTVLANRGITTP